MSTDGEPKDPPLPSATSMVVENGSDSGEKDKSALARPSKAPAAVQIPASDFIQVLREDVQVRFKEQENRRAEIDLRSREVDHSAVYSQKALDVQAKHLQFERAHKSRDRTKIFCLAGGIVTFSFVLLIYALHLGKDGLVTNILQIVLSGGFSGAGGYGLGLRNGAKGKAQQQEEPSASP